MRHVPATAAVTVPGFLPAMIPDFALPQQKTMSLRSANTGNVTANRNPKYFFYVSSGCRRTQGISMIFSTGMVTRAMTFHGIMLKKPR
jgi:hypothetical protein